MRASTTGMGGAFGIVLAADPSEERGGKGLYDLYDVGEKLGSGNFGEVRACRPRNTKDDLAVKIVDRQSAAVMAAEVYRTVQEELDIMGLVHHPNVVELREIFDDNRFLYVVMERMLGGELFVVMKDRRAEVVEDDLARVGMQLLDALAYLHSQYIVHRDIKAQNILLTEPLDGPGRVLQRAGVKLIDFGLAARAPPECIGVGEGRLDLVCGTPAMYAPEIWAQQDSAPTYWKRLWGSSYGSKVDVWAVGVVLYMALCGRLPFREKQASRLAFKVCDPDEVVSSSDPQRWGRNTSQGCRACLASLLTKDQNKRPTATVACKSEWLQARSRRRTRALRFVPQEVREAAFEEASTVLDLQKPGPEELRVARMAWREERAVAAMRSAKEDAPSSPSVGSCSSTSWDSSSDSNVCDEEDEPMSCHC